LSSNQATDEVREILSGLGYTQTEIVHALKKAKENAIENDVEILVRYSLKILGAVSAS
jgi:Holliday junction resolvasome RuvABC DNA-binding subunit